MIRNILLLLAALCLLPTAAQTPLRTDFRHSYDTLTTSNIFYPQRFLNTSHRAMSTTGANGLGVYGKSGKGSVNSIGTQTIPVILVSYPDLDFQESNDETKISRWLNEEGYADETYCVGSVADYFADNSYGLFTPTFDIVAHVTVSQPYAYYGAHVGSTNDAHATALVKEAIDITTDQGVNFSRYASGGNLPIVSIIHAGPGEQEDLSYYYNDNSCNDYIWAHYQPLNYRKSNNYFVSYIITNEVMRTFDNQGNVIGTEMTGIGTFCHEFCHALGLTDNYDIDNATNGESHTPGFWDIMDYQFLFNGYRPPCLTAYERCCLGWLDIPELPYDAGLASITLLPLDTDLSHRVPQPYTERAYRITNPENDKEYFIIENRQPARWHVSTYNDQPMLGSGMLVWHIDYDATKWNSNHVNNIASHQRIKVVPADRTWQQVQYFTDAFPGDLFPGPKHVTTFDNTFDNFYTGTLTTTLNDITLGDDGNITFTIPNPTNLLLNNVTPHTTTTYDILGRPTNSTRGITINNRKITIH